MTELYSYSSHEDIAILIVAKPRAILFQFITSAIYSQNQVIREGPSLIH